MNADDRQAVRQLLSPFAERPIEVLEPTARVARRARAVIGIQAVLSESPTQYTTGAKSWTRWGVVGAGLALAAGVALAFGYVARSRELGSAEHLRVFAAHGSILCSTDETTTFEACNPMERSDLTGIRSLDGASVRVKTQVGAQLALESRTSVVLSKGARRPHSSRVQLLEGRIDVTVPKLEPGHEFVVEAPTASITVHGTAFSVTVVRNRGGAPATCVELREGVISVDSNKSERLVAPARWGCDADSSPPASSSGERADRAEKVRTHSSPPASSSGERADRAEKVRTHVNVNDARGSVAGARQPFADGNDKSRRKSSLARETKLLQLGLGAEQKNELKSAQRHYRTLLKQYPDSVVAPEARAALERIDGKSSK